MATIDGRVIPSPVVSRAPARRPLDFSRGIYRIADRVEELRLIVIVTVMNETDMELLSSSATLVLAYMMITTPSPFVAPPLELTHPRKRADREPPRRETDLGGPP